MLLMAVAVSCNSWGFDLGDPVYRRDTGRTFRQELLYERFDRNIDDTSISFVIHDSGGSFGGSLSPDPDVIVRTAADVSLARSTWYLSEYFSVYGDLGAYNEDSSDAKSSLLVGGGVRTVFLDAEPVVLSLQGHTHYCPGYDVSLRGDESGVGSYYSEGDVELFELGGALIGALVIEPADSLTTVYYVGGGVSIFHSQADLHAVYPDSGFSADMRIKLRQESPFVLIGGVSLIMYERFSIRTETRIGYESSLTAALGFLY